MVYIGGKTYAFLELMIFFFLCIAAGMFVAWPIFSLVQSLAGRDIASIVMILVMFLAGIILFILVWKRNSSPEMPLIDGLSAMATRMLSGCFPLTFLYIFFPLTVVMLIATGFALVGLVKGKHFTEQKWIGMVHWFIGDAK